MTAPSPKVARAVRNITAYLPASLLKERSDRDFVSFAGQTPEQRLGQQ